MSRIVTARDIAAHVGGLIAGDPDRIISGVAAPDSASPQDLIFIESARHRGALHQSTAGAALVPDGMSAPAHMTTITVAQPALAMAAAVDLLIPHRRAFSTVSPGAIIGDRVDIGAGVGIGPHVFVADDVTIGRGTEIHPGVTIGRGTRIGADCTLHSGVHIYENTTIGDRVILHSGAVIGGDGFGYLQQFDTEAGTMTHRKIRHVGCVVIEDDVEVGANSTIDRASLSVTIVGKGTKIDNLVTIGHNCRIGRQCLIIGQAGIAGSTIVGNHVTIAGQAGLTGHIRVGDAVVIGAQAGVTKSIPAGQVVLGSPAVEGVRAKKALSLVNRLPEMKKTLAAHERRLTFLEGGAKSEMPDSND